MRLNVLLSVTIVVLLLLDVQPIACKPTEKFQPITSGESINHDYYELQALLGKKLDGTAEEKAKVVDLMLQLLSEIDLPTLCEVIANDTKVAASAFDTTTARAVSETVRPWFNGAETKSTTFGLGGISPTLSTSMKTDQPNEGITRGVSEDSEAYPYKPSSDSASENGLVEEEISDLNKFRPRPYKYYKDEMNLATYEPEEFEDKRREESTDSSRYEDEPVVKDDEDYEESNAFLEEKTLSSNKNSQEIITSDGTLPFPIHQEQGVDSMYNLKLDPAYQTRNMKQMHLRSFLNRMGQQPPVFDPSMQHPEDTMTPRNIVIKSVGVERPRDQLYSSALVLGDWVHGDNGFEASWARENDEVKSEDQKMKNTRFQQKESFPKDGDIYQSNYGRNQLEELYGSGSQNGYDNYVEDNREWTKGHDDGKVHTMKYGSKGEYERLPTVDRYGRVHYKFAYPADESRHINVAKLAKLRQLENQYYQISERTQDSTSPHQYTDERSPEQSIAEPDLGIDLLSAADKITDNIITETGYDDYSNYHNLPLRKEINTIDYDISWTTTELPSIFKDTGSDVIFATPSADLDLTELVDYMSLDHSENAIKDDEGYSTRSVEEDEVKNDSADLSELAYNGDTTTYKGTDVLFPTSTTKSPKSTTLKMNNVTSDASILDMKMNSSVTVSDAELQDYGDETQTLGALDMTESYTAELPTTDFNTTDLDAIEMDMVNTDGVELDSSFPSSTTPYEMTDPDTRTTGTEEPTSAFSPSPFVIVHHIPASQNTDKKKFTTPRTDVTQYDNITHSLNATDISETVRKTGVTTTTGSIKFFENTTIVGLTTSSPQTSTPTTSAERRMLSVSTPPEYSDDPNATTVASTTGDTVPVITMESTNRSLPLQSTAATTHATTQKITIDNAETSPDSLTKRLNSSLGEIENITVPEDATSDYSAESSVPTTESRKGNKTATPAMRSLDETESYLDTSLTTSEGEVSDPENEMVFSSLPKMKESSDVENQTSSRDEVEIISTTEEDKRTIDNVTPDATFRDAQSPLVSVSSYKALLNRGLNSSGASKNDVKNETEDIVYHSVFSQRNKSLESFNLLQSDREADTSDVSLAVNSQNISEDGSDSTLVPASEDIASETVTPSVHQSSITTTSATVALNQTSAPTHSSGASTASITSEGKLMMNSKDLKTESNQSANIQESNTIYQETNTKGHQDQTHASSSVASGSNMKDTIDELEQNITTEFTRSSDEPLTPSSQNTTEETVRFIKPSHVDYGTSEGVETDSSTIVENIVPATVEDAMEMTNESVTLNITKDSMTTSSPSTTSSEKIPTQTAFDDLFSEDGLFNETAQQLKDTEIKEMDNFKETLNISAVQLTDDEAGNFEVVDITPNGMKLLNDSAQLESENFDEEVMALSNNIKLKHLREVVSKVAGTKANLTQINDSLKKLMESRPEYEYLFEDVTHEKESDPTNFVDLQVVPVTLPDSIDEEVPPTTATPFTKEAKSALAIAEEDEQNVVLTYEGEDVGNTTDLKEIQTPTITTPFSDTSSVSDLTTTGLLDTEITDDEPIESEIIDNEQVGTEVTKTESSNSEDTTLKPTTATSTQLKMTPDTTSAFPTVTGTDAQQELHSATDMPYTLESSSEVTSTTKVNPSLDSPAGQESSISTISKVGPDPFVSPLGHLNDYYYGVLDYGDIGSSYNYVYPIGKVSHSDYDNRVKSPLDSWGLGLGPFSHYDIKYKKPKSGPYMSGLSDWSNSKLTSTSGQTWPKEGSSGADPWKMYNIAVANQKAKQNADHQAMHAREDKPEPRAYADYNFGTDDRENIVENFLFKARPWPKKGISKEAQNYEKSKMIADKFGRDVFRNTKIDDSIDYDYPKLNERLQKLKNNRDKFTEAKDWGNRFSQGYYGRVFDDQPTLAKFNDPMGWSPSASRDMVNFDTFDRNLVDSQGYDSSSEALKNQHITLHRDKAFHPSGSLIYDDVNADSALLKDISGKPEADTQNVKLQTHSSTLVHLGAHDDKPPQNSVAADTKQQGTVFQFPVEVKQPIQWNSKAAIPTSGSVPAPEDYKCPGLFGYHRDPRDCQAFFVCSWGMPYRLMCPQGTLWNPEVAVCDWAVNVRCPVYHGETTPL